MLRVAPHEINEPGRTDGGPANRVDERERTRRVREEVLADDDGGLAAVLRGQGDGGGLGEAAARGGTERLVSARESAPRQGPDTVCGG